MKNKKIILAVLLLLTFAVSILILPPRFAEDRKKETGFYVDYDTFTNLSAYWGLTPEQTIDKLKKLGFVGFALYEENGSGTEIFNQEAFLLPGAKVVESYPDIEDFIELNRPYTYLITGKKSIIDSAVQVLTTRGIKSQQKQIKGKYLLKIYFPYESAEKLLLGFNPEAISFAQNHNLDLLLLLPQWSISNKKEVQSYVTYLKNFAATPKVVFADKSLPENNQFTKDFAAAFLKEHFCLGLLDGIEQPQANAIINQTKLPVFRVRQIVINSVEGANILANPDEKIESLKIGIRERRNRAIVFKIPSKELSKTTVLAFQTEVTNGFKTMKDLNYQFVPVSTIGKVPETPKEKLILSVLLIILVGYGLNLFNLINKKTAFLLTLVLLLVGLSLFKLNYDFFLKLSALGASITYPLIALLSIDLRNAKTISGAVLSVIGIILVSIMGGFVISAFLTGNNFFVHADLFRGVKVSFLLPVIIFAVYAASVLLVEEKSLKQVALKYLGLELKLWQLFAIIIVFGIGAYYLLRTGNASDSMVLPGEIKLRTLLNKYLYVRPRFKEFALGYPLLLWGLWSKGRKEWRYIALVIGSLAPVTVINTFSHQYDPLWVSLIRTGNGMLLGILLGILLIIFNLLFLKVIKNSSR